MSSVVSEAMYIIFSSIFDLIEKWKKRKRKKKFYEKLEEKKKLPTPPRWYTGYVRVGDRARIVGRHTKLVVDVPYYGQTKYTYSAPQKIYVTAREVVSPEWFSLLKHLHERITGRGE